MSWYGIHSPSSYTKNYPATGAMPLMMAAFYRNSGSIGAADNRLQQQDPPLRKSPRLRAYVPVAGATVVERTAAAILLLHLRNRRRTLSAIPRKISPRRPARPAAPDRPVHRRFTRVPLQSPQHPV